MGDNPLKVFLFSTKSWRVVAKSENIDRVFALDLHREMQVANRPGSAGRLPSACGTNRANIHGLVQQQPVGQPGRGRIRNG